MLNDPDFSLDVSASQGLFGTLDNISGSGLLASDDSGFRTSVFDAGTVDDKSGAGPSVTRAGMIYMMVGGRFSGVRMPCSAVSYTMSVNKPPMVSVSLSAGDEIAGTKELRPAEAMLDLLERLSRPGAGELIPCRLYEELSDGEKADSQSDRRLLILKGYVLSAQLISDTTGSGNIGISAVCSTAAARLLARPIGLYTESNIDGFLSRLKGGDPITMAGARSTSIDYGKAAYNLDAIIENFLSGGNRRLLEMISFSVRKTRQSNTYMANNLVLSDDTDPDIMEALGGDLKINDKLSRLDWSKYMKELLLGFSGTMLTGVSIYEALVRTLSSSSYMIDLVPRWKDDFRMELMPASHWLEGGRTRRIRLVASQVLGVRADLKSMSRVNVPDAVILTSHPMAGMQQGKAGLSVVCGAAAVDPSLQETLRAMIRKFQGSGSNPDLSRLRKSGQLLKITEVLAPKWFSGLVSSSGFLEQPARDNLKSSEKERSPRLIADEKGPGESEQVSVGKPAVDFCDNYAAHVLFSRYLSTDSAEISLDPALRFGRDGKRLEDCLGYVVEVDLSGSAAPAAPELKLIGVMSSLSYRYSTGNASRMAYVMVLTRVQMLTGSAKDSIYDIERGLEPLYVNVDRR